MKKGQDEWQLLPAPLAGRFSWSAVAAASCWARSNLRKSVAYSEASFNPRSVQRRINARKP